MWPWLFLMLGVAALVAAFKTTSVGVLVLCLIAALVLLSAWIVGWLAQRVGSRTRDESQLVDPVELHRLREQAQVRRERAAPLDEQR